LEGVFSLNRFRWYSYRIVVSKRCLLQILSITLQTHFVLKVYMAANIHYNDKFIF